MRSYVANGGPLLHRNAQGSGFGPAKGGWIVLDFTSDPILRAFSSAVERADGFQDILSGMFRGKSYRQLSRSDIYVDYSVGWHYDSLQRVQRGRPNYWNFNKISLQHNKSCSAKEAYHIVTVGVYLQGHSNNSNGLTVSPRAKAASCTGSKAKPIALHTTIGDVVVFDTRALHRGQEEQSNPTHATGPGVSHRTLFTLTYGSESCWSNAFDRAHRTRNSLFNNKSLCGGIPADVAPRGDTCEADLVHREQEHWKTELNASELHPRKLRTSGAKGRGVLIVGTSRGIGLALTQHFVTSGWRVLATTRSGQPATGAPSGVRTIALDVNSAADRSALVRELQTLRTREGFVLDLLIHSAGLGWGQGPSQSMNATLLMETNACAPFDLLDGVMPELTHIDERSNESVRGACIITSDEGSRAKKHDAIQRNRLNPYAKSKLAANDRLRELAPSLRARGVAAVAVHPGWVRTEMGSRRAPLLAEQSARGIAAVCGGLKLRDGGKFFDWQGKEVPW